MYTNPGIYIKNPLESTSANISFMILFFNQSDSIRYGLLITYCTNLLSAINNLKYYQSNLKVMINYVSLKS